jgi:hypothetical protein
MPLNLYPSIRASGTVPDDWFPSKQSPRKYPIYNRQVLRHLRALLAGRWQKAIKLGGTGEVHYFEHESGAVAGVKFFPKQ